jgi:hypothetical protein
LQVSSLKRASIARKVFVVDAAGNDVGDRFLALRKDDGLLAVTTQRCLVAFWGREEEKEKGKCKGF